MASFFGGYMTDREFEQDMYESQDAAIKGVTIEQWREQAAIEQLSREKRATLGVMR